MALAVLINLTPAKEPHLPHVYLLYGQNSVALDDRVQELRQQLDTSGLGTVALDVSTATPDEILTACHSAPFFGAGRTVILKNISSTAGKGSRRSSNQVEWAEVERVISTTPETTTVILRADENLASNSVIVKAGKKLGWQVETFAVPRGEELARWVAERGHREGVSFSKNAAISLLTRLYPTSWRQESRFDATVIDTRMIATEVEKLACAADDGSVDEELVRRLVADRSGVTAFRLNDLTYSGQTGPALQELEQVLASGDEPERIIAQLASEAVGLQAASRVGDFDSASVSKVSGVSEGRLRMLRQKPVAADERAVQSIAERLRRAEWLVKTGRTSRTGSVIVPAVGAVAEDVRRSRR